jgi:hypothetical protein
MNDRSSLTEYYFRLGLTPGATLAILTPMNDFARAWCDEYIYGDNDSPPQWFGDGIVIEHHFVQDIVNGLSELMHTHEDGTGSPVQVQVVDLQ